jgi:hypothetical protein
MIGTEPLRVASDVLTLALVGGLFWYGKTKSARLYWIGGPVKLKADEVGLIESVANYAMKKLGQPSVPRWVPPGGRLRSVAEMRTMNFRLPLVRSSISQEDLQFLAPYIDEWINGHAPPQNLPAEYWDWRPDALKAFKERMQEERLWPTASLKPSR